MHETTSSQSTNPANAVYLWQAMSEMFGAVWVNNFGASPKTLWIEALGQLHESDIKRGLNAILRDGLDFPPNLPKFLKLCTAPVVEDVYKQERETRLMLENRKTIQSSVEVRKAEIAKMKAELGMRS